MESGQVLCLFGVTPCLTSDAWAAWVQAIGSIAAILVAIGISAHERRATAMEARSRSKFRARALILAIRPSLQNYQVRLEALQAQFDEGINIKTAQDVASEATPPPDLLLISKESHEFGAATESLQKQLFFGISASDFAHAIAQVDPATVDAEALAVMAAAVDKAVRYGDNLSAAIYEMFQDRA